MKWIIIGVLYGISFSLVLGNLTSHMDTGLMFLPLMVLGAYFCFLEEKHFQLVKENPIT